jgi:hypothetical protein
MQQVITISIRLAPVPIHPVKALLSDWCFDQRASLFEEKHTSVFFRRNAK